MAIQLEAKSNKVQTAAIVILAVTMLLAISMPAFSFFTGFVSYLSVGTDVAEFTVGQDSASLLTVGNGATPAPTPAATTPIDDYIAAKPVLLIIPGILLLSFIIWFWYLGFKDIRQDQLIRGLTYITLSFVLIGISLTVAMPLILQGVESTMWFK